MNEYTRIVSGQELFHNVFLEAIEHGCFVQSNGRQTVIAPRVLNGFVKVDHAYFNVISGSAA